MEKQISSKKFKTAMIAMCLGFLLVLGAVVGVWAATTQNFKAGFTVNYSVGENVVAGVRTEYYIPGSGEAAQTVTTDENGEQVETDTNGYVTFNANEGTSTKSVYIGDFTLTAQTPTIEFYFTIHNKQEAGYLATDVDVDFTAQQNIKTTTYCYITDTFREIKSASTVDEELWSTKDLTTNTAQGGFKLIKLVLSVDNTNASAQCAGEFNLQFNYSTLEKSAPTLSKTKFHEFVAEVDSSGDLYWCHIVFDYAQNNTSYQTTGTDVSELGDNSIWAYFTQLDGGGIFYVLSNTVIELPEDSSHLFSNSVFGCSMDMIQLTNIYTSNVTDMSYMFYRSTPEIWDFFSKFDTSNVTNMASMFEGCGVERLDLTIFDTSKVEDMTRMFSGCDYLLGISVSELWSTESVTLSDDMFLDCACASEFDLKDHTIANYETGCLYFVKTN